MAIKLHQKGFLWAKHLIEVDEIEPTICKWQDHAATEDEVDKYLKNHTIEEYGQWFLGVDTDIPRDARQHYILPHGDLKILHRSALIAAKNEAERNKYTDIEHATQQLIAMLDKKKK